MSYKLLLALAACLPIALSGCGGGGGGASSSSPAEQAPSGGTQTPAAALDAAKNAVAAANSAKTAAAVEAARRALAAAVETASTAVETAETGETAAQAAATKAQDYRTAQMAILDALQPVNASLATVKTASTPAEATAALTAAENAMAVATRERTAAAIDAARRALAAAAQAAQAALEAAQAALEAAQAALELAREYRTEQLPAVNLIVTTQPATPPSSVGEFDVTHVQQASAYIPSAGIGGAVAKSTVEIPPIPFDHAGWRTISAEIRNLLDGGLSHLSNGWTRYDSDNSIPTVIKRFPPGTTAGVTGSDLRIIAMGDYSAADTVISLLEPNNTYIGGTAFAFGQRWPGDSSSGGFVLPATTEYAYRGKFVGVEYNPPAGRRLRGGYFEGTAELTFRIGYIDSNTAAPSTLNYNLQATQRADYPNFNISGTAQGNNDGSFSTGPGTVRFDGDFYGPNRQEAAGTFETDSVYGSWLTKCFLDEGIIDGTGARLPDRRC